MFSSIFTLLTLLLPLTLSAPIPMPQTTPTDEPTTTYEITSFISHCSPGTCTYNFNITSPSNATTDNVLGLPFSDHCRGYTQQGSFVGCDNFNLTGVEANMVSSEEGLVLSLQRVVLFEGEMREVGGSVGVTGGGDVWPMDPEDYVVSIGLL